MSVSVSRSSAAGSRQQQQLSEAAAASKAEAAGSDKEVDSGEAEATAAVSEGDPLPATQSATEAIARLQHALQRVSQSFPPPSFSIWESRGRSVRRGCKICEYRRPGLVIG